MEVFEPCLAVIVYVNVGMREGEIIEGGLPLVFSVISVRLWGGSGARRTDSDATSNQLLVAGLSISDEGEGVVVVHKWFDISSNGSSCCPLCSRQDSRRAQTKSTVSPWLRK